VCYSAPVIHDFTAPRRPTGHVERILLIFRRYTFVVTDSATGAERRFTLPLWPTLAGIAAILMQPILIGLGARWAVRSELQELAATTIALRMENDSYRDATGQLASQISALQGAVDDIGARAAVDPEASRAMDRLPAVVKSRAMGGGSGSVAPMLGRALGSSDSAFGVLREVLVGIEDRLELVRSGVERRHALAAATPSIWPVTGWLSSSYGGRRDPFTGQNDFHPGLDISSPQGEPVLAPADGVVSSASVSGNYGNLIVLDHGFGIVTKYGHLSRFAVMNGQEVKRGDVIGFVGTTGRSTSPHLHYEIWMNGQLTNPLRLLAQR
jgi:murein DD-endopeptidase MepM/ murein hydrolase activator NlpD